MRDRPTDVACVQASCLQRSDAEQLAAAVGDRYPDAVVVIDHEVVHLVLPGLDEAAAWGAIAAVIADVPLQAAPGTSAVRGVG